MTAGVRQRGGAAITAYLEPAGGLPWGNWWHYHDSMGNMGLPWGNRWYHHDSMGNLGLPWGNR